MSKLHLKFSLLLFFIACFIPNILFATDFLISQPGTHEVANGDRFYDSGGVSGIYTKGESNSISFQAPAGYDLSVEFTSFIVKNNDKLTVLSGGISTVYTKQSNPNKLDFTSGEATFTFEALNSKNSNVNRDGWEAVIHLTPQIGLDILISDVDTHIVDEAVGFYDTGGATNEYDDYEDESIVFTAPADFDLVVEFKIFDTERRYDFLNISDGNGNSVKLHGSQDAYEFESSTGRLEFVFTSDVNTTGAGWKAIVYKKEKQPEISVSDFQVDENAGEVTFRIPLSKIYSQDVTFQWRTANVSATSPSDYISLGWTDVLIPAGSLYVDLKLTLVDDFQYEGDETFRVSFQNCVNAVLQTPTVNCTIKDNESNASIDVNNTLYTSTELVRDVLVTGCVSVDEPSINFVSGDNTAIGYFEKGASDFPLSSGIVISTGRVNQSVGRATNVSEGDVGDVPMTDVDVADLTNSNGVDAQVLEFKFTPSGDMIEFNYVFASEEYGAGWECNPAYSDVFGFILIGDDGETNTVVKRNIALIPGTSDVVSIYNVNNKVGCGDNTHYETNYTGFSTAFDGRTKVLTAKAKVKPCTEYTIRLIVSDKGDSKYDSAVFIEAGSFKSNEVVVENSVKDFEGSFEQMYEGCGSSYLKFLREDDIDVNLTFDLTIDGDAVNGVDYIYVDEFGTKLGDGKIPETVTLLAGESEVKYYYQAVKDGVREDDESFRVAFFKGCSCSNPVQYEKSIRIIDVPDIKATSTTAVSCNGGSRVAEITIELQDGLRPLDYLYSVDGGDFKNSNVLTLAAPAVGSTHTVTIKDLFNCNSADVDVMIPSYTPIVANAGLDKSVCEFGTTQLQGSGGIVYEWTCDVAGGVDFLSDVTLQNPSVLDNITAGDYLFTLTVKDKDAGANCVSTDVMKLEVLENAHFTVATDRVKYCSGEEIKLSSNVSNPDVKDVYLWTPTAGIDDDVAHNPTAKFNVSVLTSKGFYLKITKSNGCFRTETVSGIAVYPSPTLSIAAESVFCVSGNEGKLVLNITGGTPSLGVPAYVSELWKDGIYLGNSASDFLNLGQGSYTIKSSDAESCSDSEIVKIQPMPKPIGIFFE